MNAPASMAFSQRIIDHKRIARATPDPNAPLVLAVTDQLLVSEDVADLVRTWLMEGFGIKAKLLTTLLDGLSHPDHVADVGVYELSSLPADLDIFRVTDALRQRLAHYSKAEPINKVSPNHILVPAALGHSCPWGPPSPTPGTWGRPHPPNPTRQVTVIDSGFQWNPAWGENPLGANFTPPAAVGDAGGLVPDPQAPAVQTAERLPSRVGDLLGHWLPGDPDVAHWPAGELATSPEVVEPTTTLVALAGHANFIAGVIAERCPDAEITIRNHNGAFDPASDDFPTEATVARSLCRSAAARVIDLGFAFVTVDNQVSCIWERAFEYVRGGGKSGPVVFAPAGNQAARDPHYPAALEHMYPGSFPEMIGVASIDAPKLLNRSAASGPSVPMRSTFSNYGPWVTCSAIGSNVRSTFLHVRMELEDAVTPDGGAGETYDFTQNSLAIWNGTSFATPKVVAAVCARLGIDSNPLVVWQSVSAEGVLDPNDELGMTLPGLR